MAVVGCIDGTSKIKEGDVVTVTCAQGKIGAVYEGKLDWAEQDIDVHSITMPKTAPMIILGDPDQAFRLSFYPNKEQYFIEKLSQAVATIAAAFYPKDVIQRVLS